MTLILIFSLTVSILSSCNESPSAIKIMEEFAEAYGISSPIFANCKPEGETGFTDEDFFLTMYGEGEESVLDYAVMLISDVDTVGECAVFVCYTEYDAMLTVDVCKRRLSLLRSLMGSVDISFLEGCFIKRYGKIVVMCVLSDNERASDIFDHIIRNT